MITEQSIREAYNYFSCMGVKNEELDFMLQASLEKLKLQESIKEWEGVSYGKEDIYIFKQMEVDIFENVECDIEGEIKVMNEYRILVEPESIQDKYLQQIFS